MSYNKIATTVVVSAGTEDGQVVSPKGLAGSVYGEFAACFTPFDKVTDLVAQEGKNGFLIPSTLNGFSIVSCGVTVGKEVLPITATIGTTVNIRRVRAMLLGDTTTQYDITDQGGNTFRYEFNGTGLDPEIADSDASVRVGDFVYFPSNCGFNAANEGLFEVTAVDTDKIDVTNATPGIAENNVVGSNTVTLFQHRDVFSSGPAMGTPFTFSAGTLDVTIALLATGDVLFADVSGVHDTTAPKMLSMTPMFRRI